MLLLLKAWERSAFVPIAILFEEVVLLYAAPKPRAMLFAPSVLLAKETSPIDVFP